MAMAASDQLIGYLHHLGATPELLGRSDADLLTAYRDRKDPLAFTELVRRHGPFVYRACRRGLRVASDSEDAFQAVFIVLSRRISHLNLERPLAPWLFGVTVRVVAKCKSRRKRTIHELRDAMPLLVADTGPVWDDWSEILDEEIAGLGESQRNLLVLCDLQGLPHREVGERLHLPAGSISRKLAGAREALRAKLVKRGVALSAPALVAGLAGDVEASVVPTRLIQSTVDAATSLGNAPVGSELAGEVVGDLTRPGWIRAAGVAGAAATATVAIALGGWLQAPKPLPQTRAETVPDLEAIPAPRIAETIHAWRHDGAVRSVTFSPDGSTLVSSASDGTVRVWDADTGLSTHAWEGPLPGAAVTAVSPNGRWIASEDRTLGIVIREAATGRVHRTIPGLPAPASAMIFTPDSTCLVAIGDQKCKFLFGVDAIPSKQLEESLRDDFERERMAKAVMRFTGQAPRTELVALQAAANGKSILVARWWRNQLTLFAQPIVPDAGDCPIRSTGQMAKVKPPISAVGFTADGRHLVWSDDGGRLRIVDVGTGTVTFEHRVHGAEVIAVACDETRVVTADRSGRLLLSKIEEVGPPKLIELQGRVPGVVGMAIRPGGRELAVASDDTVVRRWSLETGEVIPARRR